MLTNDPNPLEPIQIARHAVDVAAEKQATDIVLLDVQKISSFTDYMVIMSSSNVRQMAALAEELGLDLKRQGVSLHHQEGTPGSGWILLDFIDVVIHVFSEKNRGIYDLDTLWNQAWPLVRIQ
jgi:ribosome-associated protein